MSLDYEDGEHLIHPEPTELPHSGNLTPEEGQELPHEDAVSIRTDTETIVAPDAVAIREGEPVGVLVHVPSPPEIEQSHGRRKGPLLIAGTLALSALVAAGVFIATKGNSANQDTAPIRPTTIGSSPNPGSTQGTETVPSAQHLQNIIDRPKAAGVLDLQTILPGEKTIEVPWGRDGKQTVLLPAALRDPSNPLQFMESFMMLANYYIYTDDPVISAEITKIFGNEAGSPVMQGLDREKTSYKLIHPESGNASTQSYPLFRDFAAQPAQFAHTYNDDYGNEAIRLINGVVGGDSPLIYGDQSIAWGDPNADYNWQAGNSYSATLDQFMVGYKKDPTNGAITIQSMTVHSKDATFTW
jgi:hypothetical protein